MSCVFVYIQVVVDCCQASKSASNRCRSNSLLPALVTRVQDSSDVLSQVVAVEMLSQLTTCYHGYEWIREQEVMSYLMSLLETSSEENPFVGLIQPSEYRENYIH